MQNIAAENNLSETAFFVPTDDNHAYETSVVYTRTRK